MATLFHKFNYRNEKELKRKTCTIILEYLSVSFRDTLFISGMHL